MRHGRTAWNVDGRYQGHSDVPLDAVGRFQATALGKHLSGEPFDLAISSDLSRARETAELLLGGRSLPIWSDSRWREMYFGPWEGLTWPQIVARFPTADGPPNAGGAFPHAPGGEGFDALCTRVSDALAEMLRGSLSGSRVLVVTHAGPLHALLHVVLGTAQAESLRVRFLPASLTRFALGPDARLLVLNQTVDHARDA